MAKLINRYALFDAIRNITYNSKDADAFFEEVLEVITEQPTTTESEIMAMAIDEFARKLLINFNDWQMSVEEVGNEKEYETIGEAIIGIEEIAERLKERD